MGADHITEVERSYWVELTARVRDAQTAVATFGEFLARAYSLGPNDQVIGATGVIVRANGGTSAVPADLTPEASS